MTKFIFWISLLMIVYTYAGYPVIITILAIFKKKTPLPILKKYPTVSVIIAVFNEEKVLRRKIENCLRIDYPKEKLEILVGSDGSADATDDIIKSYSDKGIKGNFAEVRRGKPATINALVKKAKGEILFFTDARQIVERDSLKKLVRNFQDKSIGCVSGELLLKEKVSTTGRGVGVYWKYEKYIREMESDAYSMIGATGAIYACRKELFSPLPEDTILDDVYTPLKVVEKGYRAIFEREARAYDVIVEIPREEHKRKTRTIGGNYQIFFQLPGMLNPVKSKLAIQIISHKLFRTLVPFFMVALFLSNAALFGIAFYAVVFVAQCLFYTIAILEAVFRRRIKKIFGIPYFFCLLNFSALVGLWNFLFNKMEVKWEKT